MKREYAHLLNVAGNNADYYRSCEEHKAAVASAKVHAAQVEEAQASARQALWRERELEDMRVTAIRESEMSVDLSNLANVLGRWRTGCPTRRETIESSYAQTLDAHEREDRPIDFHALPFEGWVMFLPAFLDLKVGGSHPRYDFVRSNPPAGEFVFISHRGPADPVRWQPMLPLINRYLGDTWKVDVLDGTSIVLSRRPELPALIHFTPSLLRKGEVLFGFDQLTGHPYYVPLARLTHVLVGGQSGVGKSVLLNQCLRSLLFNLDLIDELVLVDLKGGVELSRYKALSPKIRFIKTYDELPALAEDLVATMYQRLDTLEQNGELQVKTGFRIVIIDEFAAIQ